MKVKVKVFIIIFYEIGIFCLMDDYIDIIYVFIVKNIVNFWDI